MRRSKTAENALMMLAKVMEAAELERLISAAEDVAKERGSPWLGFRHLVKVMRSW